MADANYTKLKERFSFPITFTKELDWSPIHKQYIYILWDTRRMWCENWFVAHHKYVQRLALAIFHRSQLFHNRFFFFFLFSLYNYLWQEINETIKIICFIYNSKFYKNCVHDIPKQLSLWVSLSTMIEKRVC